MRDNLKPSPQVKLWETYNNFSAGIMQRHLDGQNTTTLVNGTIVKEPTKPVFNYNTQYMSDAHTQYMRNMDLTVMGALKPRPLLIDRSKHNAPAITDNFMLKSLNDYIFICNGFDIRIFSVDDNGYTQLVLTSSFTTAVSYMSVVSLSPDVYYVFTSSYEQSLNYEKMGVSIFNAKTLTFDRIFVDKYITQTSYKYMTFTSEGEPINLLSISNYERYLQNKPLIVRDTTKPLDLRAYGIIAEKFLQGDVNSIFKVKTDIALFPQVVGTYSDSSTSIVAEFYVRKPSDTDYPSTVTFSDVLAINSSGVPYTITELGTYRVKCVIKVTTFSGGTTILDTLFTTFVSVSYEPEQIKLLAPFYQMQDVAVWNGQLVMASGDTLYFSDYYTPTYFPASADFIKPIKDTSGGRIQKLIVYQNSLLVFKERSIYRINTDGKITQVTDSYGTNYPETIQVVYNRLYFFDGQYTYALKPYALQEGVFSVERLDKDYEPLDWYLSKTKRLFTDKTFTCAVVWDTYYILVADWKYWHVYNFETKAWNFWDFSNLPFSTVSQFSLARYRNNNILLTLCTGSSTKQFLIADYQRIFALSESGKTQPVFSPDQRELEFLKTDNALNNINNYALASLLQVRYFDVIINDGLVSNLYTESNVQRYPFDCTMVTKAFDLSSAMNKKKLKRVYISSSQYATTYNNTLYVDLYADGGHVFESSTEVYIQNGTTGDWLISQQSTDNVFDFGNSSVLADGQRLPTDIPTTMTNPTPFTFGTTAFGNKSVVVQKKSARAKCNRLVLKLRTTAGVYFEIYGISFEYKLKKP